MNRKAKKMYHWQARDALTTHSQSWLTAVVVVQVVVVPAEVVEVVVVVERTTLNHK
jgi:hypothetical protein